MNKIMICGSKGMAGHILTQYLKLQNKYRIYTTARKNADFIIDVRKNLDDLCYFIEQLKPDYIINCIGVLLPDSKKDIANTVFINSYFPHYLENITKNTNSKIIHLSTDCVFDGTQGQHHENDITTETNIYGRTKALGELRNNKDLTIRLSIIGKEIKREGSGLFEWVTKQKGNISGYSKALWNGITTLELAKFINKMIQEKPGLSGLYHLAPDFNISKYNLVKTILNVYNKHDVIVEKNNYVIQDKTLVNNRKDEFDYKIPTYYNQLKEQKQFNENYGT